MRAFSTIGLLLWLLTSPVLAAPDLQGVWILYRAEKFGRPTLTEVGQLQKDNDDFRVFDPALKCIPASWARIYSNTNTQLEFIQHDDRIDVRYELFDIIFVVTIPLTGNTHHSVPANFEMKSDIEVHGVITKTKWVSPYSQITLEITNDAGKKETFLLEMNACSSIR